MKKKKLFFQFIIKFYYEDYLFIFHEKTNIFSGNIPCEETFEDNRIDKLSVDRKATEGSMENKNPEERGRTLHQQETTNGKRPKST